MNYSYSIENVHFITQYFRLPCRELQVATGDWINDYLNRGSTTLDNGKKKSNNNGRLFVAQPPGTNGEEFKKNIKRSWTISS